MNSLKVGIFIICSIALFSSATPVNEIDARQPLEGLSKQLQLYLYDEDATFGFEQLTPKIIKEIIKSDELTRRFTECLTDGVCIEPGFGKLYDLVINNKFKNGVCIKCSPLAKKNQKNAVIKFSQQRNDLYKSLIHKMNE